jgi:hypothetical protein
MSVSPELANRPTVASNLEKVCNGGLGRAAALIRSGQDPVLLMKTGTAASAARGEGKKAAEVVLLPGKPSDRATMTAAFVAKINRETIAG